jgi:4-amino-4-deoxy-L-arabinose transferase-like glycosyltransferase
MLRALLLLPVILAWLGYYRLVRTLARRGEWDPDWRVAMAGACVAWGATLVLIVEVLGALKLLGAPGLILAWVAVGAGLWLANRRRGEPFPTPETRSENPGGSWLAGLRGWPWDVKGMAGVTLLLVLLLGLIASLAPSTSWDALTYHLPRVTHWIQQGSVDHFPTNNERQIEFGPGAAFVQTTVFLLLNSDRLANHVQWAAMVGSVLLATLLARLLSPSGASARTQVFAGLLVATLPIGMVESITPLVDYVTAFWFTVFAVFALLLVRQPDHRGYWWAAGLALGLGTLTKVTMVLYAGAPVVALLIWSARRMRDRQEWWRRVVMLGLAAAALNLPHLLRNAALYGSPFGSAWIHRMERNRSLNLTGTLSNVIRNAALHGQTGIPPLTRWVNGAVALAQGVTGRELNDPDTSYYKGRFEFTTKLRVFDSLGPCPWHVGLLFAALALVLGRFRNHRLWLVYPTLAAVGFLLFCAVLRWQEWHTRLHLGWLVPLMPFCAVVLGERLGRAGTAVASLIVLGFAGLCLAKNESQPVWNARFAAQPRVQQMLWLHGPDQFEAWRQIAAEVTQSGARNLGLKLDFDDPEYVLWALLKERGFTGRIDHFYIDDPSARIRLPVQVPEILITGLKVQPQGDFNELFPTATVHGKYTVFWSAALSRQPQGRRP